MTKKKFGLTGNKWRLEPVSTGVQQRHSRRDTTSCCIITSLYKVVGQSATVSVPCGPGDFALKVTFTSQGDQFVLTDSRRLLGSIR